MPDSQNKVVEPDVQDEVSELGTTQVRTHTESTPKPVTDFNHPKRAQTVSFLPPEARAPSRFARTSISSLLSDDTPGLTSGSASSTTSRALSRDSQPGPQFFNAGDEFVAHSGTFRRSNTHSNPYPLHRPTRGRRRHINSRAPTSNPALADYNLDETSNSPNPPSQNAVDSDIDPQLWSAPCFYTSPYQSRSSTIHENFSRDKVSGTSHSVISSNSNTSTSRTSTTTTATTYTNHGSTYSQQDTMDLSKPQPPFSDRSYSKKGEDNAPPGDDDESAQVPKTLSVDNLAIQGQRSWACPFYFDAPARLSLLLNISGWYASCSTQFSDLPTLRAHLLDCHTDLKCERCNKSFASSEKKDKHLRRSSVCTIQGPPHSPLIITSRTWNEVIRIDNDAISDNEKWANWHTVLVDKQVSLSSFDDDDDSVVDVSDPLQHVSRSYPQSTGSPFSVIPTPNEFHSAEEGYVSTHLSEIAEYAGSSDRSAALVDLKILSRSVSEQTAEAERTMNLDLAGMGGLAETLVEAPDDIRSVDLPSSPLPRWDKIKQSTHVEDLDSPSSSATSFRMARSYSPQMRPHSLEYGPSKFRYYDCLVKKYVEHWKKSIYHRMMQKLHSLLGFRVFSGIRNCAGGQSNYPNSGTANAPSSSGTSKPPSNKKRSREGNDPPKDEDDKGDGKKRPRSGMPKPNAPAKSWLWACWFHKHDQVTGQNDYCYNTRTGPRFKSCIHPFSTYSILKDHMTRNHKAPIRCLRCCQSFNSKALLRDHARQKKPCEIAEMETSILEVDEVHENNFELRSNHKDSHYTKWKHWYEVLFPGEHVPEPVHDSVDISRLNDQQRREILYQQDINVVERIEERAEESINNLIDEEFPDLSYTLHSEGLAPDTQPYGTSTLDGSLRQAATGYDSFAHSSTSFAINSDQSMSSYPSQINTGSQRWPMPDTTTGTNTDTTLESNPRDHQAVHPLQNQFGRYPYPVLPLESRQGVQHPFGPPPFGPGNPPFSYQPYSSNPPQSAEYPNAESGRANQNLHEPTSSTEADADADTFMQPGNGSTDAEDDFYS